MNPNNSISQEEFERIERYLSQSMTKEEQHSFEEELKSNPTLQDEVANQKLYHEAIETQSLKEQLHQFHEEIFDKDNTSDNSKLISFPFRKMIAAAVIVIALGSFWFFNNNSNEKLYAKHFSPDPGLPTTMSETANYEFYNGMVDYKQKNYKKAISKWETLLKEKPQNDTLNYFIGVAHLANKDEEKAIKYLNQVAQNTSGRFSNEAFYYLGLAHLKADNLELAKKNLTFSTLNNSKTILSKLND